MVVFRIAKSEARARDLSGEGAARVGGRWNSPGTYAVYTAMNSSLATLELLVHVDESELPPNLFLLSIEIPDDAPVYEFPDDKLPADWRLPENLELKEIGDQLISEKQYLAIKIRSAVNPEEYNLLLNPAYPNFKDIVRIVFAAPYTLDQRLT
jgi:RES domain-containing protein